MEATGFGVMHIDAKSNIKKFVEKPADPPAIPGKPDTALASMGIYVFNTKFLADLLRKDAADTGSSHDFGKDLIPYVVRHGKAIAHLFSQSCIRADSEPEAYWRDVGTIDAYWEASIDLTDVTPKLDIYEREWPIWSYAEVLPPAKFVHNEEGRRGAATSSLIAGGCIVSGASLHRSLLFPEVRVNSFSSITEAVVMPGCQIGREARLHKVVLDQGVQIPKGLIVGEDPISDAQRFRRTEKGVCLITQDMIDRLVA
jgi:glucose-1-phosphate adenylyltransferase